LFDFFDYLSLEYSPNLYFNTFHKPKNIYFNLIGIRILRFQVTKRLTTNGYEKLRWSWISKDDLLLNGAVFEQSGSVSLASRAQSVKPKPGTLVELMTRDAGVLRCRKGRRGRC